MWIVLLVTWVPATTAWCITMQNSLTFVHPQFRKLEPGLVWLTMIPVFGFVWQFIVVLAVARSLREEFYCRSVLTREPRPGQGSGLTASVLLTCLVYPLFGLPVAIVSIIPLLIHRGRIIEYTNLLKGIRERELIPAEPMDLSVYSQPAVNSTVEIEKENPERFRPPSNPEDENERWRKKD